MTLNGEVLGSSDSHLKPEEVKGSLEFSDEYWASQDEYSLPSSSGPCAIGPHVCIKRYIVSAGMTLENKLLPLVCKFFFFFIPTVAILSGQCSCIVGGFLVETIVENWMFAFFI